MVSIKPCRLPKATARIFLMPAALVALPVALAQPDLSAIRDDALTDMVATIGEVQAQEGPQSPELIDPFTALGLYYHEHGDHALAVAFTEQARQVVRVNYGLYSLEEAPLLRQLIDSEEARGNDQGAWEIEETLLNLLTRHPDDLRTVPILREIADKRLDVLGRYVGGEFPPQIVLGCYYARGWRGGGNCRAGSRSSVKQSLLSEAVSYYSRAINTLLRADGYSSETLPELLTQLVRVGYQYGRGGLGRVSLHHLLLYRTENDPSRMVRADALVDIADWDLLFTRGDRRSIESVHEAYQSAYAQLDRAGVGQEAIEQMFAPEIPVVIPTFLPNPLVSEATPQSNGFIDVAFDITNRGESDHIDILDTTTAADAAQDRLVDLIEDSLFRPRVTAAGVEETSAVVLRYYVND